VRSSTSTCRETLPPLSLALVAVGIGLVGALASGGLAGVRHGLREGAMCRSAPGP
jgi:hypothetical protein